MNGGGSPLGLYVHVPFCEAKCSYCHFAIDPRRPDGARQERYVRALAVEMGGAEPGPADTLYFGGGTPSLLAPERVALVIDALRARFDLSPSPEVTLEANPRDLDAGGYRALRALGVTRLSLGVQAFDDDVLRDMGRLHTARDARRAVDLSRAAGFDNLSLDLILGWPGETAGRWSRALDELRALAPEHVSLYVLEVEGRTLLTHRARRGRMELPDDDLVADLYASTVERLAAWGLRRYEISNFARAGRESRHNRKYWDDAPFLGFGMSAHSATDGRRWWNVDTYAAYCRRVEERGAVGAVAGERRSEALFTGLRRAEGVALAEFRERYEADALEEFGEALSRSFDAGLIEVKDDRLRLTESGMLLSNEVFQALV
jgi:oxygen-independent coproporphyrinogen-3 oxidase